MKKLTYLLVLISFIGFYSCGNSGKEKEKTSKEEVKGSTPCDEFLADYDKWTDDYIQVINDYFKNPNDDSIATRYDELMQDAMEWNTKWVSLMDCANDEKYEKKFEEIAKKVQDKMSEIGMQ